MDPGHQITQTVVSLEEQEMMSAVEMPSDLVKSGHCDNTTSSKKCTALPSTALPISPTFSPRKVTLSSFSPIELRKSLGKYSQLPNSDVVISETRKTAKRTLFSQDSTTATSQEHSGLNNCSFESDVSLSEFLNLSSASCNHHHSPEVNRYLVLEVTTQTSGSQENGRSV